MITVRRARIADAAAIGAVHVAAWRNTYPGILPDAFLARMSPIRQARYYEANITAGGCVIVAAPNAGTPRLVGFTTAGRARNGGSGLGDGEIETLYVLDDWREHGIGRRLLHAAAKDLAARGCKSAFLWVLRDNPSRFFYQHLGGQPTAQGETRVAGVVVPQMAYSWDPIDRLLAASPA
jgi:ribosomal protein S18 acetylase RimI-like enzyme